MLTSLLARTNIRDSVCIECTENGISAAIDATDPHCELLIIDVDRYVKLTYPGKQPPSPDCWFIHSCLKHSSFAWSVVELKASSQSGNIGYPHIASKFETITHLFNSEFSDLLQNVSQIRYYLACNAMLYRKDMGLNYDILLSKRFKVGDVKVFVQIVKGDLIIKNCY